MISNNRNGRKNIRRAAKRGSGTALASQRTRSRRLRRQSGLETLRSMIAEKKVGIYKLRSQPEKASSDSLLNPPCPSTHPMLLQVLAQDADS
jgi:hypothetical protein